MILEIFSSINNSVFFSTSVWHPRHLISSENKVKIHHDRMSNDKIPSGASILPEGLDYVAYLLGALKELVLASLKGNRSPKGAASPRYGGESAQKAVGSQLLIHCVLVGALQSGYRTV